MTTDKKELRAGTPVWFDTRKPPVHHTAMTGSVSTEVVVIGAGISGALVAESLTSAGFEVVVVDRRAPLTGSTSASTALLQYELDMPLTKLSRMIGVKQAETIWRRSRMALEALASRSRRLGIEAELVRRDALYLSGDVLDATALAREAEARRRAGFDVELLTARDLKNRYGIRRSAALLGFDDMCCDPRMLAAGYLRRAVEGGARVLSPVDTVALEERKRDVLATTSQGHRLRARHAVYATGYELPDSIAAKGHSIASTFAIATKPQRRALWPTECLIWEASDPYLYLRTTFDGRIICGGEDESFADESRRDALLPRKVKALERKLAKLFPAVDANAERSWTGSFGTSDTGSPSIGRVPKKQRTYAALGYGGNGITFSMLAAQLLTAAISGKPDSDAALFAIKA